MSEISYKGLAITIGFVELAVVLLLRGLIGSANTREKILRSAVIGAVIIWLGFIVTEPKVETWILATGMAANLWLVSSFVFRKGPKSN